MYRYLALLFISFIYLFAEELITPIPTKPTYNYEKALLGQKLFFDTRLSHNNTISCA
ncbi:MAG: cytochrome c peroxidase, partial [Campylobacterota bacterium]|nr:cytochrome c peroxidase [Campylobacterota bacterium]